MWCKVVVKNYLQSCFSPRFHPFHRHESFIILFIPKKRQQSEKKKWKNFKHTKWMINGGNTFLLGVFTFFRNCFYILSMLSPFIVFLSPFLHWWWSAEKTKLVNYPPPRPLKESFLLRKISRGVILPLPFTPSVISGVCICIRRSVSHFACLPQNKCLSLSKGKKITFLLSLCDDIIPKIASHFVRIDNQLWSEIPTYCFHSTNR